MNVIEWKKPDTKKYTLYNSIYLKLKNNQMLTDDKSEMEVNTGDRDNNGREHNRTFWGFGDVSYLDLCGGCPECTCENIYQVL